MAWGGQAQAIIWTIDGLVYWRMSVDLSVLTILNLSLVILI